TVAIGGWWLLADGKPPVIVRRLAERDDELPSKMIECDAEGMNGVADDRAQYRRHGRYWIEPEDLLRSLLVAGSANRISACADDEAGLNVKVVQMGFRSVDFDVNAAQAGAVHD